MGGTSGALIRQAESSRRVKTQSAAHSVIQGEIEAADSSNKLIRTQRGVPPLSAARSTTQTALLGLRRGLHACLITKRTSPKVCRKFAHL